MMCEEEIKKSSPVCVEVLKTKDIQQTDGQEGGLGAVCQSFGDDAVDFSHNPNEQLVVDRLKDPTQV